MSFGYLLHCRAAKAPVSLHKCAGSPEPLLLAYTKYRIDEMKKTRFLHNIR